MNKAAFLAELEQGLSGLPREEAEERLAFYAEMIDDRMEEGIDEEAAVAGIGPVEEIAAQTLADISLTKLVRERIKPRRTLKGWEIALIILGFPLWFPLLVVFGAVLFSLYAVIWAVFFSLWAVELILAVCGIGGIAVAAAHFAHGNVLPGVVMLGISLLCCGLSVFLFFGCLAVSKWIVILTKKMGLWIKSLFVRKEDAA